MWLAMDSSKEAKASEGKPKFDQPEADTVAQKLLALAELQKQGRFRPQREQDVLGTDIGQRAWRPC